MPGHPGVQHIQVPYEISKASHAPGCCRWYQKIIVQGSEVALVPKEEEDSLN